MITNCWQFGIEQQQQHPFNGLFSTETLVSRYQKGRTIPDFNKARDDGMAVASA